ncbi:MAG TPA: EAL domain-containing protein [Acidobacteriaceae bacterium]
MLIEDAPLSTIEKTSEDPSPAPTKFVARQPILDLHRTVIGYELLFRSGWENAFRGESGDATRQMLDNCLWMDIDSLTGHTLAFINCTREALVGKLVTLLPPATTVLEILETVEPDRELIAACVALKGMGYRLALDDFLPRPEMQPLIDIATYIKVDFRLSDVAQRKQIHDLARGSGAILLAEKVEDQQEFDTAVSEGYQCFQGYFFCRPKIIADREIPPNRMNYLRLLVELSRNPLNLDQLTRIARSEPSLGYRLLRLSNSALVAARSEVTSFLGAFMLVGEDRFRKLVSVAASGILGHDQPPAALITLSLERARFCELLAPMIGENSTEQFLLGMLSLVDAVMQIPMETVVKSLPLRPNAKAALLGEINPASLPLCLVRSFENGAWGACSCGARRMEISEETLAELYLESVQWANEVSASTR